jgi:hypothetical protein
MTTFRASMLTAAILVAATAVTGQDSPPATPVRADADDAQAWERALSLSDEFLVQLALARGLDPARAELLRDLYQERRSTRRRDIGEAAAGRMTKQQLRLGAARASTRLDEQIRELLTPAEILTLDEDEARAQAVTSLQRIDAVGMAR